MKRISSILVVTVMLITVALTMLYAHSKTQNANRRIGNTNTPAASSDKTAEGTQTPRKAKVLVKRLPNGVEGVELKDGKVRLKDGYKFVKNDNGTVTVARMNGGLGVKGTWSCGCTSAGSCVAIITTGNLHCDPKPGCSGCEMLVVVGTAKTTIMR